MNKELMNIHPGEILLEDFLKPMEITAYKLAQSTHIDQKRISEIIHGRRSITADTALRFSRFFGNSPEFWLSIQAHYDLELKQSELKNELKTIKKLQAS
ncbi:MULTISPECIES: HigA family addiction module antitoxin [Leptospira]|uniref:Pirin n=2 Tax=Leptospira TaxID=171 RepID=A0A2P1QQV2_9LEPT|nr:MULTISPECIES: HigA family addiction module antitoxin [Leptospira]ASV10510.1 transcriptional regulator [Leptospira santarosai]AVQ11273.1 Pirin [Leptospira santarosai]AVV49127.1 Pirin [Leptospira santarosai]AVV80792.1 Pirin [Leptospira santarosai]KXZ30498.1 pirin [Leptospira santarosai]